MPAPLASDAAQLPHLLRLIDDPSRTVRVSVLTALERFGAGLEPALRTLDPSLDDEQLTGVLAVVDLFRRDHQVGPRFDVGQVVRHRRFGYRALIVACDLSAGPSADAREEPWYHLLVHGSDGVTAARQGSLEANDSGEGVRHPLVPRYFGGFRKGLYMRNDVDWDGA
ncbi:MAG: heat shock protein HspQ [Planctomycetota bacterium]|nr:MAG: heat shock protein HspQ [Planctomycetota bacterium]